MRQLRSNHTPSPSRARASLDVRPIAPPAPPEAKAVRRDVGNPCRIRFPSDEVDNSRGSDQLVGPTAPTAPLLLAAPEVATLLGLGLTKVYELIARDEIPVIRIGRCVRVPHEQLTVWIATHIRARESSPLGPFGRR